MLVGQSGNFANIKPMFQIKPLPGKVKSTVYSVEKGALVPKEVMVDAGWLVCFPKGHSIRVTSKEELEKMRLNTNPDLVDMSTGERLGASMESMFDLEQVVADKTLVTIDDE